MAGRSTEVCMHDTSDTFEQAPSPGAGLGASNIFRSLEADDLGALAAATVAVRLAVGETLFRQGEPGSDLYVLLRGRLAVAITQPDGSGGVVDTLEPGDSVGELALLTGQPRGATVYALEETTLARLSREQFERIAAGRPGVSEALARVAMPRIQRTHLAGVLSSLFGTLEVSALHELQQALEWRRLSGGETLFHKGDPGDALYIVVSGLLRTFAEDEQGNPRSVGEITRGETVGEVGLLTGAPRSATVVAVRDSDVVRLSQAMFERLLGRHPRAMLEIARIGARRIQRMVGQNPARVAQAKTIAILPAVASAPLAAITEGLVRGLATVGPTLHLNRAKLPAGELPDGPASIALVAWLSEQEASHRFVVYEANPDDREWTERCVRQADTLLLVAPADAAPPTGDGWLAQTGGATGARAHVELLLVHADGTTRPQETARWLAGRQLRAYHHLRPGSAGDWRRLVRRLTGRAIGLTLGGGGARCFAHVGVAQALHEAGVEFDIIGGASMGAVMGGMVALGMSPPELRELTRELASRQKLLDLTPPFVSFFATEKITRTLRMIYGETRFEDLWQPFFCVSTNLSRTEGMVHSEGPLWSAVRASSAVPGIFSPMLLDGDVLVDGGLLNNLPLDLMRERTPAGPVIGVNVSPLEETRQQYRFGPSVSGWKVLLGRFLPPERRILAPPIAETLVRCLEVGNSQRMRSQSYRQLADVLIDPALERYGILDFEAYQAIISAGYEATLPHLPRIKALCDAPSSGM